MSSKDASSGMRTISVDWTKALGIWRLASTSCRTFLLPPDEPEVELEADAKSKPEVETAKEDLELVADADTAEELEIEGDAEEALTEGSSWRRIRAQGGGGKQRERWSSLELHAREAQAPQRGVGLRLS
ncbi:hypothetical protein E2562_029365 [Oryza meyeriana var. granulata]|uniref:Uncharacterized protein n=1 Tax=Oryza meyeriana var. granulata TaxID=110450 RepID=A0A6G1C9L4_9ORYZ|nr:hypothetical protein E2562_029365 [Oryza meyeriana var. granulata]